MTPPYRRRWLRPLYLLAWRLREREVVDARETTGAGKAAPSYEYGKVTGLTPDLTVTTETTESPYVCCGYCSAGMACRAARTGLAATMDPVAHKIRSQGGRPHDNGSKASELRNGARSAHGVELDPLARDEIPGRLRGGYAVVVNLDYAELPGWLKTQGGSFGHSALLFGWRESDDCVGYFDPLYSQGARGAWAPWGSIKPALWGDGEHSSTVERITPPPPEPAPTPPVVEAPCYSELELRQAEASAYELGYGFGAVAAGDAAVGAWVEWLTAPRSTAADRWDVGTWADGDDVAELDVDPCDPGAPAAWARGGLLAPVADALTAIRVPAAWEESSWRAAVWR